ncbi:hypothetical protein [Psychromonas aquatilis]|uniref:CobQ/CobB/MinD/ParA nucleotide binding domain-containing protein n=1 Tax=Psychromonas aquatilis TaxID=2005072 RepID=A0ABU9GRI3_9GAMM
MSNIMIFSIKGGEGKTVLSTNLAAAIDNSLLAFCDNTADMDFLFQKRNGFKLKHPDLFDLRMVETTTKETKKSGEIIHIDLIDDVINYVKNEEKETGKEIHTIYDTGGYNADEVIEDKYLEYSHHKLIMNADYIVIPIGITDIEIQSLKTMSKILERISSKVGRKIIANVVPCRIHPNAKITGQSFQNLLNEVSKYDCFNMLETIINEHSNFKKSMSLGLGVVEAKQTRSSKSSRQIKNLIRELDLPLRSGNIGV